MIARRSLPTVAGLLLAALPGLVVGCADRPVARDATTAAPRPPVETDRAPGDRLAALERRLFELTNRERRERGLDALEPESTLAEIARRHSADMLERDYFAHESPEGNDAHDRIAAGHRRLVGLTAENLWSGSGYDLGDADALARVVVDDWMASRGHRENILRPEYTHLGIGVAAAGSEVRMTQNFAQALAFLERPLPASLSIGAEVDLKSTSYGDAPPAELFDLWSPRRRQAAIEPSPVDAPRLEAPPGAYSLRLYFPEEARGSYAIYYGPRVELRR